MSGSKAAATRNVAKFESIDEAFEVLRRAKGESLLKKHLTADLFAKIKHLRTPRFGSSLLDIIQSGVSNPDSGVGVYAADCESYNTFESLFEPIIREYHGKRAEQCIEHPDLDFGEPEKLEDIDVEGKYVISTRCRVARSLADIPLAPCMSEEDYVRLEARVRKVVEGFGGDLRGKYLPLGEMSEATKNQLIAEHFLFKEGDRFLEAANALRHWPKGRGIYMNEAKSFLIWVGEEDHLRVISMQKGANIGQVVSRLERALKQFSQSFQFAHSKKHGFLTLCSTNLGSTIRASVHIKLPNLRKDMDRLQALAKQYNLQIRGIHGEHSESEGGVYDISNKRRHGFTESQVINDMYEGCKKLIEIEKSLE